MSEQPILATESLWFSYPQADWSLQDVTLSIDSGEFLAIIGPNGAGKSTLAKQLNGLLRPSKGSVWVMGRSTGELSARELAGVVGYLFQNPDHQIFAETTFEEVAFGPRNLGLDAATVCERTEEALSRFGLSEKADHPPAILGFAVRRMVALAAVYAMRPRALILDEPTGGLDGDSQREVMDAVAQLHAQGHAIILISHDLRLVAEHAERVICLHQGRVAADASPAELFRPAEGSVDARIEPPEITRLSQRLRTWGMPEVVLTVMDFASAYVGTRSWLSQGSEDVA